MNITCQDCGKDCKKYQEVDTGGGEWEMWCYCDDCEIDTFHPIVPPLTPEQIKELEHPMMVGISHPCELCGQAVQTIQFERDKELIEAVKVMRDLQKAFFKDTRKTDILNDAKAAEKRVDALLSQIDNSQVRLM